MTAALMPDDEGARLEALRGYEILDTPPEGMFDELADLARYVCRTPTGLITLVDTNRQWFKSRVAFEATETPRDLAFCAHTILGPDVTVVPDALRDPRFADNPLVTGPPAIRFYAGAPLRTSDGQAIGSLAVLDYVPRDLDEPQRHALRALSHQVMAQLELRRRSIADRRALEERATDSEAQMQSLLEAALDCIVVMDHLGRVVEFNPAAEKTFGRARGDVLGKEMAALIIPAAHRDGHRRGLARYLATGSGAIIHRRIEITAMRADGVELPVELTIVRVGRRSPPLFAGFIRELTERKLAEAKILRSEQRYRELVEGIRDAIFTVSSEGVITSANQASETILGWPTDVWIGRHFLPMVHPSDQSFALQTLRRVLAGERPSAFELRLMTRAGTAVALELTASAQLSGGPITGVLCVARDIAERHRLEEQVRQAQKMEALGQLSGGVAHDFNNLLTVIQCNAMLLTAGLGPAEIREHADEIVQASERAAGLTRQLLLLSRKQAMQPTIVDVNGVVGDMTRMLSRIVGEDVTLSAACGADVPSVQADVGMLEQVLLNLVVNARDAMPGGGEVTIRTGETTVSDPRSHHDVDLAPGRYAWVSVADTGTGIDPGVLPRIFEPFYTTKEVGRGTGLGLATVYAIVRQHRGWIEASSEIGRGATFRFFLPAWAGSLDETIHRSTALMTVTVRGTETILVVEDENTVRLLVANMLERCGYTVLQASSSVDALDLWNRNRDSVRMLVTDLIMPGGLNGRELASRIRRESPGLAVIYTSGYSADVRETGEALVDGVNFLQKPYNPSMLARVVRALLDRGIESR